MKKIIPVCTKCGERYYTKEKHEKMQKMKRTRKGSYKSISPIGHTYAYEEVVA
jgi:uncharacterized protein with PIN domain